MRAPEIGGVLQVGSQKDFDGFPALNLVVEVDSIKIERKDHKSIQIEAPVRDPLTKKRIRRELLADPVIEIELVPDGDKAWQAPVELADASCRVGLSRFFAKVGEIASKKGPVKA